MVDWTEVADLTEVVTVLPVGLEDMALGIGPGIEGNLVVVGSSCIEVR